MNSPFIEINFAFKLFLNWVAYNFLIYIGLLFLFTHRELFNYMLFVLENVMYEYNLFLWQMCLKLIFLNFVKVVHFFVVISFFEEHPQKRNSSL
jgi:hypothetical protein